MKSNYRQVAAIILKKNNTYLLVKKPRKDNAWQFPQGGVDEGETHAQAAVRELNEECGATLEITINETPLGSYAYTFPEGFKRHAPGIIGAEITFFESVFESGTVEIDNHEIVDYLWATKDQIKEKVSPQYWDVIKKWL